MRARPRTRLQMHSGNDLNRWTVSFADFMTLMFAVFVVLYAASSSNEEKHKEIMLSIQNASKLLYQSIFSADHEGILTKKSNSLIDDSGPAILSDDAGVKQAEGALSEIETLKTGKDLNQLQLELQNVFLSELDDKSIVLKLDGDWLTIEMGGGLLFVGGSHTLLISAKKQINRLAKVLKSSRNMLRIRGYTDQEVISNEIYLSNWELAGARAFAVLHELNDLGILGKRMAMEAYGPYHPVFDKKGQVDKLNSRRVVIAISKYALVEDNLSSKTEKQLTTDKNNLHDKIKPDSEEMHELHLPNSRLIITTRQK